MASAPQTTPSFADSRTLLGSAAPSSPGATPQIGKTQAGLQAASGILAAGQAVGGLVGGVFNAVIANRQAKMQAEAFEFDAKMAEMAAGDTREAGDRMAEDYMEQVGQLIASQRASAAGQGVKANVGVVQQLQDEARHRATVDVNRIKANAARQAFALSTQARGQLTAAAGARASGAIASGVAATQGVASFLEGGMRSADRFSMMPSRRSNG